MWISKWKSVILEIQQFCNLKRGNSPQNRSNYESSLSSFLLPLILAVICLTGKKKYGGSQLRHCPGHGWGDIPGPVDTKKLWQGMRALKLPILPIPGAKVPCGHHSCRRYNLLASIPDLDASCDPNSWLGRWLSSSQLALSNKRSAQASGEKCTKGICGRSWGIRCIFLRLNWGSWMEKVKLEEGSMGERGPGVKAIITQVRHSWSRGRWKAVGREVVAMWKGEIKENQGFSGVCLSISGAFQS